MGLFSNLFGGEKNYKAAIDTMEKEYGKARTYSDAEYGKIVDVFLKERAKNAEVYSQAYNASVKQYSDVMAQSRKAFAAEGAKAYKTLEVGRDATLALLKQQTDFAVARQQLSGMLTGLSNTTFGQAAVNAVAAQGALQAGAVQEQYAQTLASARMAQAGAMAGMEQQAAQSLLGAGLGSAQYQSGLYQQYTTGAQASRGQAIQQNIGLRQSSIENRYNAELNKAMMDMQAGNALGGALLGAGLGVATGGLSMLGGPAAGMLGGGGGGGAGPLSAIKF
jgi:hypothetical protein